MSRCLVVNPGPVKTEWQSVAGYDENTRIPPGMITAEQCVSDALQAYDRGKRSMITGRFFPWFMRASKRAEGRQAPRRRAHVPPPQLARPRRAGARARGARASR